MSVWPSPDGSQSVAGRLTGFDIAQEAARPTITRPDIGGTLVACYRRGFTLLLLTSLLVGLTTCESQPSEPETPVPTSVEISPEVNVMAFGSSLHFSAVVFDQYGETMPNERVSWSASPGSSVTIDSTGLAAAVSIGDGTITATAASVSASINLTVDPLLFASISSGYHHTCALTSTGAAYCWGFGEAGQLGDGTSEDRSIPGPVSGGLTFSSIDAGYSHTCALTPEGAAYCWGTGPNGQLGAGTTGTHATPVRVSGGHVFASISSSSHHTCGVTTSGDGYCWGHGTYYKLGNGSYEDRLEPSPVSGGVRWSRISTGWLHTCGLSTENKGYCWGAGNFGRLGNGSTADIHQPSPAEVVGGIAFESISAGQTSGCGLDLEGATHCWGTVGKNNDPTEFTGVPTRVDEGIRFSSVSLWWHACALTAAGAAFCWGAGNHGALGTGAILDSSTPVPVSGNLSFSSLSVGEQYTCGVTAEGAAYCWGIGERGQLGNGLTEDQLVPVPVLGGPG